MEKIDDSTSDEWIVDGDLYLIKTISRYPILWDRKTYDSDQRNEVWLKLSKKLKIKLEWLKKRWSYLREQYVRNMKQINNVESDKPFKKNYKYFNELSFLADHIQIRNGNYQEMIFHKTKIEADSSNNEGIDSENVDFIITENEIEAYNDDDDNLFVELSDDEKDEQLYQSDVHRSDSDLKPSHIVTLPPLYDDGKTTASDVTNEPIKYVPNKCKNVGSPEFQMIEQHLPGEDTDITNENHKVVSNTTERCEDVIFGELVTSMLKKMDSPNRKRAKKEILNILLS